MGSHQIRQLDSKAIRLRRLDAAPSGACLSWVWSKAGALFRDHQGPPWTDILTRVSEDGGPTTVEERAQRNRRSISESRLSAQ